MPERSTLFKFVQIAREGTVAPNGPGVHPLTGWKRLLTMAWEIQPNQEFLEIRGSPYKFPVGYVMNKDFTSLTVPANPISYNEIIYIFHSALRTGVPTTTPGPPSHTSWLYEVQDQAGDPFTTYSLQQGDTSRSHEVNYAVLTGFDLEFSRDGVTIAAEGFAQELQDEATWETGATDVPLVPVLPTTVDAILADNFAGLSTPANQQSRVVGGTLHVANRQMALWTVDSRQDSYAAVYETAPEATLELHMEADDEGMAWLAAARTSQTKLFRLRATGPEITTGVNYSLQIDMAVQVNEALQFEDTDGLWNVAVSGAVVHDSVWGKSIVATVQNTISDAAM